MDRIRRLLFLAVAGLTWSAGCASPALPDRAPEGDVRSLDGKVVRASAFWAEKPVLLVFMTAWCGGCREEIPLLNELSKRHSVVAISTGDPVEKVEQMRRQTGMLFPIYLDAGPFAKAYGIQLTPTCILVGRDGVIRHRGTKPPEGL